jgi:DNA-binding transcriptional LysR family regulator
VPLALALALGDHCTWSIAAQRALDGVGRAYRVAYSAGTLMGTLTPVMAGLAVTVSPTSWLPEGLRVMRSDEGMPPLPEFGILLLRGADARQPVTDALAQYITDTFRADAARPMAA